MGRSSLGRLSQRRWRLLGSFLYSIAVLINLRGISRLGSLPRLLVRHSDSHWLAVWSLIVGATMRWRVLTRAAPSSVMTLASL
jgi:hypothetical protein